MKIVRTGFALFILLFVFGLAAPCGHGEEAPVTIKSLTLQECFARALANNLDIKVERFNPTIADWGIVHEQGVYDPLLQAQGNYEVNNQPQDPEQARELGVQTLDSQQFNGTALLTGHLPSGTQYQLAGSNQRFAGSIVTNAVWTGQAGITVTQPLLKNSGFAVNSANIRIARKTQAIAVKNLAHQIIDTISDVEDAYYDLIFAIEDHKAKLEDLNGAKALLEENRKRAAVGFMAPLEVTQAEAGVAEREDAVLMTRRAIEERTIVLKRLITQDMSEFNDAELLPVDFPVAHMVELDKNQSIRTALTERPDYLAVQDDLERQHIYVQYTHNQMWPQVDLQGGYGFNGLNGVGVTNAQVTSSFGGLIDDISRGQHPYWSVGVVFSMPLGDRQARADYRTAKLRTEQAVMNLKRMEQDIIAQVENAIGEVRTNLKRLDATRAATRLAQESVKAEETKLRAGFSTSFLVLQARTVLADTRSAEIRARADYYKSLVELARADGTTLQKNNITVAEDGPSR